MVKEWQYTVLCCDWYRCIMYGFLLCAPGLLQKEKCITTDIQNFTFFVHNYGWQCLHCSLIDIIWREKAFWEQNSKVELSQRISQQAKQTKLSSQKAL